MSSLLKISNTAPSDKTIKRKRRAKPVVVNHQRYATFSLELLLNEDHSVRRTKATHVQSGESKTWASWMASEVIGFIESKEQSPIKHEEILPPKTDNTKEISGVPVQSFLNASVARMSLLGVQCEYGLGLDNLVSSTQPYAFHLALDVSDEELPRNAPLNYQAVVQAKQLGSGKKINVGTQSGIAFAGKQTLIQVNGEKLVPGTYRLDASVTLRKESARGKTKELLLWHEGGLLKVY